MILLSYTIVDFHLFYDGAVDIHLWAPPTRSQCKVCDTQVTVKACGPLFKLYFIPVYYILSFPVLFLDAKTIFKMWYMTNGNALPCTGIFVTDMREGGGLYGIVSLESLLLIVAKINMYYFVRLNYAPHLIRL